MEFRLTEENFSILSYLKNSKPNPNDWALNYQLFQYVVAFFSVMRLLYSKSLKTHHQQPLKVP